MEDRARVVAEPNRGGGLVERDDGARELAQVGGIERENGCPPLIVALLEERDLALLELADLRSVRIEPEEDLEGRRRLGVGLPLIVIQRERRFGERGRAQKEVGRLVVLARDAKLEPISPEVVHDEWNGPEEGVAPCLTVVREAGPEATRVELCEVERARLRGADGRIVRVGESKEAGVVDLPSGEVREKRSNGGERRARDALVRRRRDHPAETTPRVERRIRAQRPVTPERSARVIDETGTRRHRLGERDAMRSGNRPAVVRHADRVRSGGERDLRALRLARLLAPVAFSVRSVRTMKAQEFFSAPVLEDDLREKRVVGIQADRVLPGFQVVAGELRARRLPVRRRLEVEQHDVLCESGKRGIGNEVLFVEHAWGRLRLGRRSAPCGQDPQEEEPETRLQDARLSRVARVRNEMDESQGSQVLRPASTGSRPIERRNQG